MPTARLALAPGFRIGEVDRRLSGSFVDHMGRCAYTGVHEPEHLTAGEEGFRTDVLNLTKELGATTVRYPGGNCVSKHHWRSVETNTSGLNRSISWARKAGVEPMMAISLGTRGVPEALALLEYTHHPGGRPARGDRGSAPVGPQGRKLISRTWAVPGAGGDRAQRPKPARRWHPQHRRLPRARLSAAVVESRGISSQNPPMCCAEPTTPCPGRGRRTPEFPHLRPTG